MIEIVRPSQPRAATTLLGRDAALEHVVSGDTHRIITQYTDALRKRPTPGSLEAADAEKELAERLFDAIAGAKMLTAQVAMHLDREWRDKIFQQLDSLHDADEWQAGDEPIRQGSFSTFLKAMLALRPGRRPGLGLSHNGQLVTAWTTDRDRLTIEFFPNDRVRWVLVRYIEDEPDRFAGETPVSRLGEGLAPYHPEHWFVR